MGSWNETCMLTNLPIEYGDKIIAFPIYLKGQSQTATYATSNAAPNGFPVVGTYDDYGYIEIDEQESKQAIFFNNMLFKEGELSLEESFYKNLRNKEESDCALVYMHYGIATNMIDKMLKQKDQYVSTEDGYEYVTLPEYLDKEMEESKDTHRSLTDVVSHYHFLYRDSCVDISMILEEYKKPENDELIRELYYYNCLLENLRKKWHVPAGSGSQESDFGMIAYLSNQCLKLIKEKAKEYASEVIVTPEEIFTHFGVEIDRSYFEEDE